MDLTLVVTLSLCCWTAAARYVWTDKPWLILSDDEINVGESTTVSCTLPVDYRGGDCRLYRGRSHHPFTVMVATSYVCEFKLTSEELLGGQPEGSEIPLRCDYHLQSYTSTSSDTKYVTIWGTRPSPSLSVSRHFVSPEDSVEVTCSPPSGSASRCHLYRDQYSITAGSCRRNVTGRELGIWEKPTLLLPVNLSCTYDPVPQRYVRSERSNHLMLFVVDASRVTSSVDCRVSVRDDELEALEDRSWTSVGTNGSSVTVHVTNGNVLLNETCSYVETQR